MMSETNHLLFSPLPERRPPWKEFLLSYAVEAILLTLIVWAGVVHPEILVPKKEYRYIGLVNTPPPLNVEPQPKRALPPQPAPKLMAKLPEIPENLRLREAPPKPKPQQEMTAPQLQPPPKEIPKELERVAVAVPRKPVQTNVFSTGNSQAPTINKPVEQVQTGGFGDPNGVPAHENHGKPVTIAQAGSYDLPGGPGYGNGTGGANGAKGVVPSAGFGNGVAIPPDTNPRGRVREAGFGDSEPTQQPNKRRVEQQAKLVPAEIISKPTPAYTPEARSLKIEGEVLLEVVFEASGKLRVVRVVRGLGHGLDEAAVQAAEQIKFKPAQREGQPADSSATLHIVFQLT